MRIVVPTHGRPDDLVLFLDALLPQLRGRSNVRLTIVNDGTHSEDYERVIAPHKSLIDYRIRPEQGGCGAARRTGARGVREDYIVTSDDDCIPPPCWVAQMVALVERHPEVDVISGLRYFMPSKNPGAVERFFAAIHGAFGVARSKYGIIRITTPTAIIRRQTYERSGGFDADFKIGEDTFLTLKLLRAGASFLVADNWLIGHKSEQRLGGEIRRYYHYGYATSHYLLVSQDWRMDPTGSLGKTAPALRSLYHWHLRTWNTDEVKELRFSRKIPLLAVSLLIGAALQVGIARGMRHFGKEHPIDLPTIPPPKQQMSGFVFGAATLRDAG